MYQLNDDSLKLTMSNSEKNLNGLKNPTIDTYTHYKYSKYISQLSIQDDN